ncbi:MAG: hypothetical protein H0U13_14690, partial [Gemmatimonadaceae bacterium]|nr:hypothetical protein [Gemmatimonadaceae bacterium]
MNMRAYLAPWSVHCMSKLALPALDARALSLRTLATLGLALVLSACDAERTLLSPSATVQPNSALSTGSSATADVLIGFTEAPGADQVTLVESLGGRVTRRYKYIPVVAASIPVVQRDLLAGSAGVRFVEDDNELAPYGGKQIIDYGVSKIEAPAAWGLGYSGQNVKVAIFDSGIDLTHPDLVVAGGGATKSRELAGLEWAIDNGMDVI